MEIQKTIYSIIIVTAFMALLLLLVNKALTKFDPLSKPKGVVLIVMMAYDFIDGLIKGAVKKKEIADKLVPYFMSVILYIFLSNIAGLFSIECPTSNYSVTLSLALITCVLIEVCSFKVKGGKSYAKGWFEPFAPFVVMNVISKLSTLLSLSLRLFGNILAGGILMSVIYQLFARVSALIPVVGNINIVAIVLAPFLHFYFDLFSGVMQSFLFTNLSVNFIGNEIPNEE
ncbi:MAG: FoF1 ATP synthase subunit a [Erysipelotrichaceae bacterium]|nr:FoF1 ATP synthase subunit a [Erysipelotrichaceae bacterium]